MAEKLTSRKLRFVVVWHKSINDRVELSRHTSICNARSAIVNHQRHAPPRDLRVHRIAAERGYAVIGEPVGEDEDD